MSQDKDLKYKSTIGGLVTALIVVIVMHALHDRKIAASPATPPAETITFQPGAVQLGETIQKALIDFDQGQQDFKAARDDMNRAEIKIFSAKATAMAADGLLCSGWQLVLDRSDMKLKKAPGCVTSPTK